MSVVLLLKLLAPILAPILTGLVKKVFLGLPKWSAIPMNIGWAVGIKLIYTQFGITLPTDIGVLQDNDVLNLITDATVLGTTGAWLRELVDQGKKRLLPPKT